MTKITPDIYRKQRYPRFGTTNPEKVDFMLWETLVKNGEPAYWARNLFDTYDRDYSLPVWSFDRFGMSETTLPDGRIIHIAGEHEDFYDADFNIYNDVIVIHPDDTIAIYIYPKAVFPPTDFHTATLVDNHIYIIGCLGYMRERPPGRTPVYRLDCTTYRIESIATTGNSPGRVFRHEAIYEPPTHSIIVAGGSVIKRQKDNDTEFIDNNTDLYTLNLKSLIWTRV